MKSFYTALIFLLVLTFLASSSLIAQEQIGGPYTKDANTLMLLHFDNDFVNQSDFSDDGVAHGSYQFFPVSAMTALNSSLRLDNDALSDSSYVTVPDNDNLDLTGSWTIEGWINVFTFGQSGSDHRWVPRLCIKPGDQAFWQPNWWVELWGDNRWFQVGFHTEDQANWPAVTSAPNVMQPGEWVHLTFIRDDSRKILIQMVHDASLNLKWFGSMSYAGLPVQTPVLTAQDVHMGWAGAVGIPTSSTDSWLDGFIDEVRISNVVRDFAVPPIITYLSQVENQEASVGSYEVKSHAFPFHSTGTFTSADLKYSIDGGNSWSSVAMTGTTNDTLVGTIPQQPIGSVVQYYVEITDDRSQTSTFPSTGVDPLSFGVFQPNTKVLDLDFESNSFPVSDNSPYNQTVVAHNGLFTNEAKEGSFAYDFFPKDTLGVSQPDSIITYLSVDSPFLTMKEFALDYWFKFEADTIFPYIRMIIRSASGNHVDQNYYVRTEPGGALSARYQVDPNDANRTKDNVNLFVPENTLEKDKWYHVLFERSNDLAVLKIGDENNNFLAKGYDAEDIALNPPRPGVTPLRIGWAGNNWEGTYRNFIGKMDAIKIYNYAALNLDTLDNMTITVGVEDEQAPVVPFEFELTQNYPNPFNPSTSIKYEIPEAGVVSLAVYDILGKKVATLVDDVKNPGNYEVVWNGKNSVGKEVASGVYFYTLKSNNRVQTLKMLLLR